MHFYSVITVHENSKEVNIGIANIIAESSQKAKEEALLIISRKHPNYSCKTGAAFQVSSELIEEAYWHLQAQRSTDHLT